MSLVCAQRQYSGLEVLPGIFWTSNVPPNNRMQRSGHDKVHAPDCHLSLKANSCALQAQRAVADAGRWAAPKLSC
jgi:hypothetical protein